MSVIEENRTAEKTDLGARGEEKQEDACNCGLLALCGIAAYFRIAADPEHLKRELALFHKCADESDIVRGAQSIGLKARVIDPIKIDPPRDGSGSRNSAPEGRPNSSPSAENCQTAIFASSIRSHISAARYRGRISYRSPSRA